MSDTLVVAVVGAIALVVGSLLGNISVAVTTWFQFKNAEKQRATERTQHLEDTWREERKIAHRELLALLSDDESVAVPSLDQLQAASSTGDRDRILSTWQELISETGKFHDKFEIYLAHLQPTLATVELVAGTNAADAARAATAARGQYLGALLKTVPTDEGIRIAVRSLEAASPDGRTKALGELDSEDIQRLRTTLAGRFDEASVRRDLSQRGEASTRATMTYMLAARRELGSE